MSFQDIVVNKKTRHDVQPRTATERSDEFLRVFESGFLSDICLEVGSKPTLFQAHQVILSISSQFFRNFFYNVVVGPETVLKIRDANAEDFEEILKFIYTEKLRPRSVLSSIATCGLAKRFQIPSYISASESYIAKNVIVSNVIHVYEFALREDLTVVTESARESFCTHAAAIFKTHGFLSCSSELLEMIVQDVHKAIDLYVLMKGLYSWSADWTQRLPSVLHIFPDLSGTTLDRWYNRYKTEREIMKHALVLPIKSKTIMECNESQLFLCCRWVNGSERNITVKGVAANVYKKLPFASSRYRATASFQTDKGEKRRKIEVERVDGLLKFTFSRPFVICTADWCNLTITMDTDDDIYVYELGRHEEIQGRVDGKYFRLRCHLPRGIVTSYGLIALVILEGI